MRHIQKSGIIFFILVISARVLLFPAGAEDKKKNILSNEIVTGAGLPEDAQADLKESLMPHFLFTSEKTPPAPDYRILKTWAALPFVEDKADIAPAGTEYPEAQNGANVDVFFVHPTGYSSNESWNGPWDDPGATKATADMMLYCASAFNAACKVYAPRYRQCTIYAVLDNETTSGIKAIDLAYSDVERAFEHYIKSWNKGRPFILAGHSQGSFHSMRLLQEKIINTPLAKKLVAAYLIGYAIPENITGIKPSRMATDIGTVIGWNSYTKDGNYDFFTKYAVIWLDGSYKKISDRALVQVNPLSWKLYDSEVSREKNRGSLPQPESDEELPKLVPKLTGADASGSVLIITKPQIEGFPGLGPDMPFLNPDLGDYHIYDYQLFYEDIRKNVVERARAFKRNAALRISE